IVPAAVAGQAHEAEALDAERALAAAGGAPSEPAAAPAPAPPPPEAAPEAAEPAPAAAEPAPTAPAPAPQPPPAPAERLAEPIRLVGETAAGQLRLGRLLHRALGRDPEGMEEYRAFSHLVQELQDVAMLTRMVPLSRAVPGLQRAVREVARITG